ncbi:MAG: gamma-glutamyltransferase family protein [Acidiferrobacterales bacterium]|nr:gamma-glutamyltransferase family protein [Acidiferrobacterales bacterium]
MAIRTLDRKQLQAAPFHPRLFGFNGAVTSEHYLAAGAGADVLKSGGNAVDATVAAVLVEGVVNPHQHTIGGECPMLIQMADQAEPIVVNGNTVAPASATVGNYMKRGYTDVPDTGILAAGVPAALGACTTALENFGTMSFSDVCGHALDTAKGFPLHRGLLFMPDFGVRDNAALIRSEWPNTAAVYLPDDELPNPGQLIENCALADVFQTLMSAERVAGGTRENGIAAARKAFYSGDIASEIARHSRARDGFLSQDDMQAFVTRIESPVSIDFDHVRTYKCGPWNQGPALLQALSILKNFPLADMGHNSTEYLHTVIEAVKLAFADREQWYGDPEFVKVPIEGLLSDEYGALRAKLIDSSTAGDQIVPGDPNRQMAALTVEERIGGKSWGHGTVHVDAIDRHGTMVAATPSGGWLKSSELVKSLGVPLGNRLMTFYLAPDHHPGVIAPFKQPRTTISPTLVHRAGQPWMVYGSMGGDQQDQWMLQFLLNKVVFDMTIAQAIEAPKFSSHHFPGYFAPHEFQNRLVAIEEGVGEDVLTSLQSRGHAIQPRPDWTEGYLLAIERDPQTGLLEAGCDPRGAKGDVFPAAAYCW